MYRFVAQYRHEWSDGMRYIIIRIEIIQFKLLLICSMIGDRYHPPAKFQVAGLLPSSVHCYWRLLHVPRACRIFSPLSPEYEFDMSKLLQPSRFW